MSSALAIAGVTAALKDVLNGGLAGQNLIDLLGENVTISALPPDAVRLGSDVAPRLNLFLHQVTHNAAWRNAGLPLRDQNGAPQSNAPLALDLHYMLTAYAGVDLQAEVILGCAMLAFHETPVLARAMLRKILNPPQSDHNGALPSIYEALRSAGLADQIEQIKIVPADMSSEELSRLWSAFQAHYRPSVAYHATVVLIDPTLPSRSPLPVLKRGPIDPDTQRELATSVRAVLAPVSPQVTSVSYPRSGIAGAPGDTLQVVGHELAGSGHTLVLSNPRLGVDFKMTPASTSSTTARFDIPDTSSGVAAGTYLATLAFRSADESKVCKTNTFGVTIAPLIVTLPETVQRDTHGDVTITLTCKPAVLPGQRATLILDAIEAVAAAPDTPVSSLRFTFNKMPPGTYRVRFQIDGVDSPFIDRTIVPPRFTGPQIRVTG